MHSVFRSETVRFHRRLNSLPGVRALVLPGLTPSAYLGALTSFAQVHALAEPEVLALEETQNLGALQGYTPRLPSLCEDLSLLGGLSFAPWRSPGIASVSEEARTARYFGLRYVLDGASQGGRHIERRLRKNAPELAARAFAFWTVQGRVAAQWPALCDHITELALNSERKLQMVVVAKNMFQMFIECFQASEQIT